MTPDLYDFAWRIAGYVFIAIVFFAIGITASVWFEKPVDITEELVRKEHLAEAQERGERR